MDTRRLLKYLKCAIDLESAKLACENAKNEAWSEISRISRYDPKPIYPPRPQYYFNLSEPKSFVDPRKHYDLSFADRVYCRFWQIWDSHKWKIIIGSIMVLSFLNAWGFNLISIIVLELVYFCIAFLVFNFIEKKNDDKHEKEAEEKALELMKSYEQSMNDYKTKKHKAEVDYQNALANWERITKRMDEDYRNFCYSRDQQCAALKNIAKQLTGKETHLWGVLAHFYDQGPLHVEFQNLVALTQIYFYLDSGIATELEGPNGAYAQYSHDVRTKSICDNLEKIRESMQDGFNKIANNQMMLYDELVEGRGAIRDLVKLTSAIGRSVSDSMNTLQRNVNAMQKGVNTISSEIFSISENTSEAALNTAMISLNQYIDMKSRGLDAYYFSYPN